MSEEYRVGYGKPPQHTRFQKGKSGNPRGRPKHVKNLKTDLLDELQERILVREGSGEKPFSKQRLLLKRLIMNAIKGDTRATTVLLNTMLRLLDVEHAGDAAVPLNDDESAIIAAFEERLRRRLKVEAVAYQPINTNHMTK